jgi:hypothetical protein
VKITVIATGFKDSDSMHRRRKESRTGFGVTREAIDFGGPEPDSHPPIVMQEAAAQATQTTSAEGVSLETMRGAMLASFEQEDLDVPAFLRKRVEPM